MRNNDVLSQVMIVEETQYDEVVTCDHSYNKRCHTSYVTSFVSTQQEECDENFRSPGSGQLQARAQFLSFCFGRKVCYIEYEPQAYNETVEVRTKTLSNRGERVASSLCPPGLPDPRSEGLQGGGEWRGRVQDGLRDRVLDQAQRPGG